MAIKMVQNMPCPKCGQPMTLEVTAYAHATDIVWHCTYAGCPEAENGHYALCKMVWHKELSPAVFPKPFKP